MKKVAMAAAVVAERSGTNELDCGLKRFASGLGMGSGQ